MSRCMTWMLWVIPQPMPFMLLGNSFLTRFQMKRDNNLMTLDKRY